MSGRRERDYRGGGVLLWQEVKAAVARQGGEGEIWMRMGTRRRQQPRRGEEKGGGTLVSSRWPACAKARAAAASAKSSCRSGPKETRGHIKVLGVSACRDAIPTRFSRPMGSTHYEIKTFQPTSTQPNSLSR